MTDTATTGERSAQSYVHECGDGAYISMTLSDGPPGHVYPDTVTLPGACVLCEVEPVELLATTAEHLAALNRSDWQGYPERLGRRLMTPRAHYFGDGCPAPHGAPDAPRRWEAYPGEPVEAIRDRYGQPPGAHNGPGGSGEGESHTRWMVAGAVA